MNCPFCKSIIDDDSCFCDQCGERIKQSSGRLRLINRKTGAEIIINSGDIIGRTSGPHTSVFGAFPVVSENHARISYGSCWEILDLGSTNGTYINGNLVAPGTAGNLSHMDKLKIANIEFIVYIDTVK